MFLIFSSFYLTYCSSLFIFVIASSCFGCFLVSLFFSPLLFIISPLLCLSTPLLLAFPFSSLFSFCCPLFHFYLMYFFISLPFHLHCLIHSPFFFLCLFPFVLFFSCLPSLYLLFYFFFLALFPTLLSTFFTYSLSYYVAFLRHSDCGRYQTGT